MLGNIKRVRHVAQVVRYVLGKPNAQVLDLDSLTDDPGQFAAVVARLAEHHPRLQKPVAHADIDLRPGLKLTDDQWRDVVRRLRERMGYANAPFLLVRHSDARHDHVHVLFGTVRYDGTVVPDKFEIKRFHAEVGKIAQEHGMRVEQARDRSAGHRSQYWQTRRGDPLKEIIAHAYEASTFQDWQDRLRERGVEPSFHLRRDGHLQGLAFRFDDRWVKARALGKQFAAAQLRRQYDLEPDDVRRMLHQNRRVGRGRTEVALDPTASQERQYRMPPETVLTVGVDGTKISPALPVEHPGKPPPVPRSSRRLKALYHALGKPTMPLRVEQHLSDQPPARSSWLEPVVAQRIHPDRAGDPIYREAARHLASHLATAPESDPWIVIDLAKNVPPDPRLRPLLDRIERIYGSERHLRHLAADPEGYASKYWKALQLRSHLIEAKIHQTAPADLDLPALEREIRANLIPRTHRRLASCDPRAWRRELAAGRRSDAAVYLLHYKALLETHLARAGPDLWRLAHALEERLASLSSGSLESYALHGRAAALRAYLALHDPVARSRFRRPRRPIRLYDVLRYLHAPLRAARFDIAHRVHRRLEAHQAVRAFRRMRSPLRGAVRELANNAGRPYLAAAVLVPAITLGRQLRRSLRNAAIQDAVDSSVESKVLLRALRGRPLSAALTVGREGVTSGFQR